MYKLAFQNKRYKSSIVLRWVVGSLRKSQSIFFALGKDML